MWSLLRFIQNFLKKLDNPSDNAGMSNEKGISLALSLWYINEVTASKFTDLP